MDQKEFDRLVRLFDTNREQYRAEVLRLRASDPDGYDRFLEFAGDLLEKTHDAEDRPLTEAEVDDLIEATADELGWSRRRVLAESVLRLQIARAEQGERFTPVSPEEKPERRSGKYRRARSSLNALATGDVKALLEKKAREREQKKTAGAGGPPSSPGRYRGPTHG